MDVEPQQGDGGRKGGGPGLSALALPTLGSVCCILVASLHAQAPDWWAERGVVVTNAPVATNDFAPANAGQLKHVASRAAEELDARLPGGAGSNILGMVAAWTNGPATTNDFAAVNIGQVKATARPFYDRFAALGILTNDFPWTAGLSNGCPWAGGSNANDFAMANVGQIKRVFAFDLTLWNSDDDHLPDAWEEAHFGPGNLSEGDGDDSDGDGVGNLAEFLEGWSPTDFYNMEMPLLTLVSGDGQTGFAETFLNQPLVVRVSGGSGWLSNAPVVFSIDPAGGLSATYGATNAYASLALRSDGQGLVSVYAELPDIAVTNVSVIATAISGTGSVSVSFLATSVPPGPLAIAAGGDSGMAVAWSSDLLAWGENRFGQMGDGSTSNRMAPVPVGVSNVTSVAAGPGHALAVLSDGSVVAWGCNRHGELGVGDREDSRVPVLVTGLTNVVAVGVGGEHGVAVDAAGQVWSWGANWAGQLGTNVSADRLVPAPVLGVTGVIAVAAGRAHTLALGADGLVYSWGDNRLGQLGVGSGGFLSVPTKVDGVSNIVAIGAGQAHSVALSSDGSLLAWGANWAGQLGDGSREMRAIPAAVSGLVDIVCIAAGGDHTVAVSPNGICYGFGANWRGQLSGTNAWFQAAAATVSGSTSAVAVTAGFDHTLIQNADGAVSGVGANTEGQLGDGSGVDRSESVSIGGL